MSTGAADGSSGYVLLTPTWRGDLPFFERLRRSIERVGIDAAHYVVVDTEDLDLFRPVVEGRDQVHLLTTADVLPTAVERRRTSRRAQFGRWNPTRYFHPRPISGWWAQMFVKLQFSAMYDASPYLCVDSDLIFLRTPGPADFVEHDGVCPLYFYEPKWVMEAAWFVRACMVLGIPRERLELRTHTTTPQLFAPAVARALCAELEQRGRGHWYDVMEREGLAEYETYAAYATHKWNGAPRVAPTLLDSGLVLTQWHSPADADEILRRLAADPSIRYLCVQSKIPPGSVDWERVVTEVIGEPV